MPAVPGRALFALLALTLTLERGDCVLERATIEHVPPATVRVMAIWRCGGLTCWNRYVEVNGQKRGESSVCEVGQGNALESGAKP